MSGKVVFLVLGLVAAFLCGLVNAEDQPRVQLHELIQKRPSMPESDDAAEMEIMRSYPTRKKAAFHRLRNAAPWARPNDDGSELVAWDQAEPMDPDYKNASPEAVERFLDMKFGVRIYMGVFTVEGGTKPEGASWHLTWSSKRENQDGVRNFLTFYQRFNPKNFNGDQWGKLFSDAGFKFSVMTMKNHDGFCMWPTKTKVDALQKYEENGETKYRTVRIPYCVTDTPCKRDLMREYAEGLRKHNVAVGFYFSHPDWLDYDGRFVEMSPWRDPTYTIESDPEGYRRFALRHREQLMEMCTQYGKIDILSFDHGLPLALWPELKTTLKMIRRHQPDVMMRTRGIGNYGDYYSPEGWNPEEARGGIPWTTIRKAKVGTPAENVIPVLIRACAMGGSMQWNAHPRPDGTFDPEQVTEMLKVGRWLKVNGEGIYATRPWKLVHENEIYFTRSKDEKALYAFLMGWPGDGAKVTIRALSPERQPRHEVTGVSLIGCDETLSWNRDQNGLTVTMSAKPAGEFAYVLKIALDRKPNALPKSLPNYKRVKQRGIEDVPVPEYRWASEEAYQAFLDIAEIVSNAVCALIVRRNVQANPDEFEDADWDLYYAMYSKHMTRFLPIAHKLQCPEDG